MKIALVSLVSVAACACASHGRASNAALEPAPWLEAPALDEAGDDGVGGDIVAIGRAFAVAGSGRRPALVHADRGLVGYVRLPPAARWIGLGEEDAILVATTTGALLIASPPEAAIAGELEPRGVVEGAVAWDSAERLVAAAAADRVHVSIDGGRSFAISRPAPGSAITRVIVRPPATVVARSVDASQTSIWISIDAGATWAKSPYAPPTLTRLGRVITDAQPVTDVGSVIEACPAVLGRDGTWRVMPAAALATLRQVVAAWPGGRTGDEAWYGAPSPTAATVDVVDRPDQSPLQASTCRRDVAASRHPVAPTTLPVTAPAAGCCVENDGLDPDASAVAGTTSFALADDGQCDGAQAGVCRGAVIRWPHVVVTDRSTDTIDVSSVPAGCVPRRLLTARGLGVLVCERGDVIDIHAMDATRRWRWEASFPSWARDLERLGIAADGTLVLTTACQAPAPCTGVVRRPWPVGRPGAWWIASYDGAVGYRADARGRALAVVPQPLDDDRVTVRLWRLRAGHPAQLVVTSVVPAPLASVQVSTGVVSFNGAADVTIPR